MGRDGKPNKRLIISDLNVTYRGSSDVVALQNVSVCLSAGEIKAVVGESGSGKTTLARTLLSALPPSASVRFRSLELPERVAFIQQEAVASLHPLLSVGMQISDILAARRRVRLARVKEDVYRMFEQLGLVPAGEFFHRYAHQLSGGQAQRVSIARALALQAELIVADEPTSQLDLITQADAVRLLYQMTKRLSAATLLITHRLPLVAEMADSVIVLHEGTVVERGPVSDVWRAPRHWHTQKLLDNVNELAEQAASRVSSFAGGEQRVCV